MIHLLPLELAENILSSLELKDILSCQAVNSNWYELCNSNKIWKTFWPDKPFKDCNVRKEFNWLLLEPCTWKLHYLKHMRVVHNWKNDTYKKYEIRCETTENLAYDGTTLVVQSLNYGVEVYELVRGHVNHLQNLKFKKFDPYGCLTNTQYIIVRYCTFIIVYELIKFKYKIIYMIYIDEKHLYSISESNKMHNKVKDERSDVLDKISVQCQMGLVKNTLFIFHYKLLYVWKLKEQEFLDLIVMDKCPSYYCDKNLIYISNDKKITAFDENMNNIFTLKSDFSISKLIGNKNVILGVDTKLKNITVWEKKTKKIIASKSLKVSTDFLLHPVKDVLLDVADLALADTRKIYAIDLWNDTVLWTNFNMELEFFGELRNIVADKFVLLCTYANKFNVHDTSTGNYLYSLYNVHEDDMYSNYDILIYRTRISEKLIVHVYS